MKCIPILLATLLCSCASFSQVGTHVQLPIREPILDSNMSVRIYMLDGNHAPMCTLPGADNEIDCFFTYGFLETSALLRGDGGYLFLSFDTARIACGQATRGLGFGFPGALDACARGLLQYRWVIDNTYTGEPDENK